MKNYKLLTLLLVGALLAACASNGNSITPNVQQVNLQNSTALQVAVGTANIGQLGGAIGLNVVSTFRQQNGDPATLVNTPAITGPAGFVLPANAPSYDAGTNHISGSPQNANPNVANPKTTFGMSGGVYSYGFDPFNLTTSGAPRYPGSPGVYALPFYSGSGSPEANLRYVGGPPAYAFFNDGTFPPGFAGYSQGFTMFNAAPVAGGYTLSFPSAAVTRILPCRPSPRARRWRTSHRCLRCRCRHSPATAPAVAAVRLPYRPTRESSKRWSTSSMP